MSVTRSPVRRLAALAALAAILGSLLAAAPVAAHAVLEATSPAADSAVETPPHRVAARFNEALEGDSSLELLGPDGTRVASGGIDPDNPRRLVLDAPADMPPGEYEVRWQAFSDDGHLERGTFSFTVLAPPPTPEPSATPVPSSAPPASAPPASAEPTDAPLPSPSASPAPAPASGSDVLLPIVAAVVVILALGLFLLRGRARRST